MSYMLCGLRVDSELPLPDLLPWTGEGRAPDIEIRLGEVPDHLEDPVHIGPLLQTDKYGTCRYSIAGVAAYLVEAGKRITIQPWMPPDAPDVRVFLLGSVFGFLCHQRGLLPLHAGCVEIDGRAVAFAGHSGAGKSTLTTAFLRRGFPILADDVTVVDVSAPGGPLVLPSFPRIKLWGDAMEGFGLSSDGLERVRPQLNKFQVPVGARFRAQPLPLSAVYHLKIANDRRHEGLEPLRGASSMNALVDAVYRRMSAFRMGQRGTVMGALMQVAMLPNLQFSRVFDLREVDATAAMIAVRHATTDASGNS